MRKILSVAAVATTVAAGLAVAAPADAAATHCDTNAFCAYEGNNYSGTRHILPANKNYIDIGGGRVIRSISNNSARHVCLIKWDGKRRINITVDDNWESNNEGHYGVTADAMGDNCWR